jgi:aconitate hydratase
MGVIPMEFHKNQNLETLGIENSYKFNFNFSISDLKPRQKIKVEAISDDGQKIEFETLLRIDTPIEIEYLKNGGVLQYLLRQMLKK